jgi:TM2 domain-containing membrane protein YozV
MLVAYILWFFLGYLGIHRFYCGRYISGIIWFLTGGLFGIGWIIDIFLIPGMVLDDNYQRR